MGHGKRPGETEVPGVSERYDRVVAPNPRDLDWGLLEPGQLWARTLSEWTLA
jgi:hypothetical protein